MRILLLTQWFEPEPTFKGLTFAKALQNAGHHVEVITGFPNYPGGKIYPGYKIKWRQKENIDGIKVTRVFLFPSHDSSAFKRIVNYISFAVSACLYGLFTIKKIDVIYVYHPPITVGLAAVIISSIRRIPFVLDVQDLWPDTLRATGMINNKVLLYIVKQFCKWVYSCAKHIVVLSPGFLKVLVGRGVTNSKISVIYNWADEQKLFSHNAIDIGKLGMLGRFNVVFAGNIGKAQSLDVVLFAAKQIEKINPLVQFVFVGKGVDVARLQGIVQTQLIKNVLFLPQMPMSEVGAVLQAADVLLVHLKDDPLFEITIPSKTQAYLAIGKPILMAVNGDSAALITQAKAGYCALPGDVDSITESVLKIANSPIEELIQMGLNGRKFYNENLSINIGVEKFLRILSQVAGKGNVS